jgi:hypothetical protein
MLAIGGSFTSARIFFAPAIVALLLDRPRSAATSGGSVLPQYLIAKKVFHNIVNIR